MKGAYELRERERFLRKRAIEQGATVIENLELADVIEDAAGRCYLCTEEIELHGQSFLDVVWFDHVIPVMRGGQHTRANLRPTHPACNRRKGVSMEYAE